ncbi:hypothetical protein J0H58_13975 [bacterium]|nr:hypothetical protein [bacterium]
MIPARPLFTPTDASPTFVLDVGVSLEWVRAVGWASEPSRILALLPTTVPLVSITWPTQMAEGVQTLARSGQVTTERADRFLSGFDNFKFLIDADRFDRV